MKQILIVDDEVHILELLKYNLESAGFVVIEATSGESALDELEKRLGEIDDILLLSSLESMARETRKENVNLSLLARESAGIVQETAKSKGLRLTLDIPEHLGCFCNPDRIKQVMINLLDNAVKYTEKGEVCLSLTRGLVDIKLVVSDTGIGFDSESESRIFERFYRVDRGRSRSMGGTGLGLSIVKHIVLMHGGNISATSKWGEGSRFVVSLPCSDQKFLTQSSNPHFT